MLNRQLQAVLGNTNIIQRFSVSVCGCMYSYFILFVYLSLKVSDEKYSQESNNRYEANNAVYHKLAMHDLKLIL